MSWIADKVAYRNVESFTKAYKGTELLWEKEYKTIIYTSTDGNVVTPFNTTGFGATIVSNTYSGGRGVITFDGPVTSIGYIAFRSCSTLETITVPDSVTSIGNSAFIGCSSLMSFNGTHTGITADRRCICINGVMRGFAQAGLTSYVTPNSITAIGDGAFDECDSLTSITISDNVTSLGVLAVGRCDNLINATIGSSVYSIDDMAFYGCISLSEVICNPIVPPNIGYSSFGENAPNRKIKVPSGSVDAYKTATNWSEYASDIISQ